VFGLSELMRQMDSINTSNVNYLYCLNKIKGKWTNKMSENYIGNEPSHAVKLHVTVLRVADIACACNSHFNIPTRSHTKIGIFRAQYLSKEWNSDNSLSWNFVELSFNYQLSSIPITSKNCRDLKNMPFAKYSCGL